MSHRHNHLHNCSCRMLISTSTTVTKPCKNRPPIAVISTITPLLLWNRRRVLSLRQVQTTLTLPENVHRKTSYRPTYSKSLVNHTILLDFSPVGLNLVFDMQQQWMGKIPTDKYSGIKNQIFLCRCSFRVRHTRLWSRTSCQQTRPSLTELLHPPKHVSQAWKKRKANGSKNTITHMYLEFYISREAPRRVHNE